jgi:hypothetical protein
VIENNFVYPYGTTEMYPESVDSNLEPVTNSAHYYMECSNKGNCDRKKGTCSCYPGYDGASCQRASCPGYPNSCSGHGVCKSIQQLANADAGNTYELWDRHKTMGCECDAGFYGPDCSARKCKTGVDPLYMDDSATIKYPIWNVATLSHTSATDNEAASAATLFYNGMVEAAGPGYWALRIYDAHGEDWLTEPIPGGATCAQVKQALYNIPNDVVPDDSVSCTLVETGDSAVISPAPKDEESDLSSIDYLGTNHERAIVYKFAFWEAIENQLRMTAAGSTNDGSGGLPSSFDQDNQQKVIGFIYRLKMFGNPGALKEPEIEIYLDGDRPTLAAIDHEPAQSGYASTLITKVWTDGMQGEDNDYFADHCDGVTVNVLSADHTATADKNLPKRVIHYLGLTAAESLLLKSCLGSANFQEHDNIDSYDWDYGSREFPHIVKLVRSVTSVTDGGHYVALIFKPYATHASALSGNGDATGYYELVNPWVPLDAASSDTEDYNDYEVYTTKGVLALTSDKADAFFGFAEKEVYTMNVKDELLRETNAAAAHHFGSLSCEWVGNGKFRSQERAASWDHTNFEAESFEEVAAHHADGADPVWGSYAETKICLNKTDIVIPLAIPNDHGVDNAYNVKTGIEEPGTGADADDLAQQKETDIILNHNPPRINMYTVENLYTREIVATELQVHAGDHNYDAEGETDKQLSHMWRNVIKLDKSTNWGTGAALVENTLGQAGATTADAKALLQGFRMYKFHPAAASTYNYVAPCSNRGLCDSKTGICECFPGYGNDNCDEQNALAL